MAKLLPIKGYEGIYEISNGGSIYSIPREKYNGRAICKVKGGVKKQTKAKNGYMTIRLWKEGKSKLFLTHRLVAEAFLDNIQGLKCVNHIDCDKTNNNATNLEWVSHSENMVHAYENGLYPTGIDRYNAKLTGDQVKEIRSKDWGISINKIADIYGISPRHIRNIMSGKGWKYI